MPNIMKELSKCKHPNSRRTKQMAKKAKKINTRDKIKLGHAVRSNILGEKLAWFTDRLEDREKPLSAKEFQEMITEYFERFNEELEQIKLKQSISKNRAHQHVSRQNAIEMTIERERNEYNTGGIELIDFTDPVQFTSFKSWDGNAINIQHLKLKNISRKYLDNRIVEEASASTTNQMDEN